MKLLLTGGDGMLGLAVRDYCKRNKIECVSFRSGDFDLSDTFHTNALFAECAESQDCTHVLHLAAKVGGVKANIENPEDFYYQNALINANVLHEAARSKKAKNIQKVLSLMSSCVYPALTSYPLHEYQLHLGPPHETNFGYAYAKRMLDVQSRALNKELGYNKFITAIPNNLYGPYDNYDYDNSHVVPAITRKMYETKLRNADTVVLWGDGTPEREFTYSKDMAEVLIWLLKNYDGNEPLNVGSTENITIKKLAETIKRSIAWEEGKIKWDTSQPSGQKKKPTDNSNFQALYEKIEGKKYNYTDIEDGIVRTSQWFVANYPDLRGIE